MSRAARPGAADGKAQYFENYNANKRSVVVDVATDAGRDLVRRLVAGFDVFVENQGPRVMEKLGLDPAVAAGRPPGAHLRPHQGVRPLGSVRRVPQLRHARPGGRPGCSRSPARPTVRRCVPGGTFGDTATGAHTAMAILAAYVQQQRTGEGQVIEMSMHEVMTMFIRTTGVQRLGPRRRAGAAHRQPLGGAPTDMYRVHARSAPTTTCTSWSARCRCGRRCAR